MKKFYIAQTILETLTPVQTLKLIQCDNVVIVKGYMFFKDCKEEDVCCVTYGFEEEYKFDKFNNNDNSFVYSYDVIYDKLFLSKPLSDIRKEDIVENISAENLIKYILDNSDA